MHLVSEIWEAVERGELPPRFLLDLAKEHFGGPVPDLLRVSLRAAPGGPPQAKRTWASGSAESGPGRSKAPPAGAVRGGCLNELGPAATKGRVDTVAKTSESHRLSTGSLDNLPTTRPHARVLHGTSPPDGRHSG